LFPYRALKAIRLVLPLSSLQWHSPFRANVTRIAFAAIRHSLFGIRSIRAIWIDRRSSPIHRRTDLHLDRDPTLLSSMRVDASLVAPFSFSSYSSSRLNDSFVSPPSPSPSPLRIVRSDFSPLLSDVSGEENLARPDQKAQIRGILKRMCAAARQMMRAEGIARRFVTPDLLFARPFHRIARIMEELVRFDGATAPNDERVKQRVAI